MKRVAVIRGGPSEEHAVSMKTGRAVLGILPELGYSLRDIVITREGEWLANGKVQTIDAALEGVDVVFLALHGAYGEDGQIQKELERRHIPFTGSGSLASGLAFNKAVTKRILESSGIQTPRYRLLSGSSLWSVATLLDHLVQDLGHELFLKPVRNGSSVSTFRVRSIDELENALEMLLPKYGQVLIEEFIAGREATVGILQDFRDQKHYALPSIEITPESTETYFTETAKYNGRTTYTCPGNFTFDEKAVLSDMAILAHTTLGCDHYSRSDFLVTDDEIYFLEINTLPALTEQSLIPKSAAFVGLDLPALVNHLVITAKVK